MRFHYVPVALCTMSGRAEFGGERCAMNRRGSMTGSDPTQTPMRDALNQLPVDILKS